MLKVAVNLFYRRNGARRERDVLARAVWGRRTRAGGYGSIAGTGHCRGTTAPSLGRITVHSKRNHKLM